MRLPVRSLVLLAALAAACHSGTTVRQPVPVGAAGYNPARDLGALFHDVELAGVFPDSKTFVDARPRLAPADIRTVVANNTA